MNDPGILEYVVAVRMACMPSGTARGPRLPRIVSVDASPGTRRLLEKPKAFRTAADRNGLGDPLLFPEGTKVEAVAQALEKRQKESGRVPRVAGIGHQGVCVVGDDPADCGNVLAALHGGKGYEESVTDSPGRVQGCIAIVTGAAQGFGKGIAEELIREGACVIVADLNDDAGALTCRELNRRSGTDNAVFCHVDVTNLDSLNACAKKTVETFGGVDMLVSNAGVLKAGSIADMDEASFDLVTGVNYKAYFLGTKAVLPVMKLQNRLNAQHGMDIVQINSKSGLQGSNKNFAYAGSKFGCIGLTQSFALELAPYNIRVNSICPGNYLDGPLWSDPDRGLFVQYLKAGKVPGAKTVDDVKASYLAKVPLGRGCLPSDVAKAIFYVREQRYETGQAIPVTGGQVMLR